MSDSPTKYIRLSVSEEEVHGVILTKAEELLNSEDAFEAARIGIDAILKYMGIK